MLKKVNRPFLKKVPRTNTIKHLISCYNEIDCWNSIAASMLKTGLVDEKYLHLNREVTYGSVSLHSLLVAEERPIYNQM